MTLEQFVILQDKITLWRRVASEGVTDLRDYNQRAADALSAALIERADLMHALVALRCELGDRWWQLGDDVAENADAAIARAEGSKK